jgi:hypothetical protein
MLPTKFRSIVYFQKTSPLKPHGQMIRNLVGSIYGKSSYKDCSFCPNLLTNMATTDNSFLMDMGQNEQF